MRKSPRSQGNSMYHMYQVPTVSRLSALVELRGGQVQLRHKEGGEYQKVRFALRSGGSPVTCISPPGGTLAGVPAPVSRGCRLPAGLFSHDC